MDIDGCLNDIYRVVGYHPYRVDDLYTFCVGWSVDDTGLSDAASAFNALL